MILLLANVRMLGLDSTIQSAHAYHGNVVYYCVRSHAVWFIIVLSFEVRMLMLNFRTQSAHAAKKRSTLVDGLKTLKYYAYANPLVD